MMKERTEVVILVAVSVISTLFLWLPLALNVNTVLGVNIAATGIQVLERYYDGPLYVIVAKTFYTSTSPLYGASDLPATYFAAHLPGYPVVIWLFALAVPPFVAMLVANLVISAAAVVVFLLPRSALQACARSVLFSALVPLLSTPLAPLSERRRIGTALYPTHLVYALRLKAGRRGKNHSFRRFSCAYEDLGGIVLRCLYSVRGCGIGH